MGAVAVFDYASWVLRFPEMVNVTQDAATLYFNEACIYWRNDGTGPVKTVSSQQIILNLLTAHIAWLNSPRDDNGQPATGGEQPAPATVGVITSATQGSVSVGLDVGQSAPGSEQWFKQSRYGYEYYTLILPYRLGPRYRPPRRRRIFDPLVMGARPWPFT